MTVKDIIKIVCEFVGEREILKKLNQTESVTFSEREQEKLNIMTNAFNLVNQEIASDYLPYLVKENICVDNSTLNFSTLSKTVINIYEVKTRLGSNLKFKVFPEFVEIYGRARSIIYSALPEDLTIDGQVELYAGLSGRIFAYGVASEYLLIEGLGEEAEIWEERFKESLFMLSRKRGEHIMPRRSWF